MTCKYNVPVNFEATGTILILLNRSLYLPKKKTTTTTTENHFRTGHEKQEIVCFSITTPFYDTLQRRTVDRCALIPSR